ncbi:MAG: hypothetical protein IPO40_18415 [Fibrobacteres bacterium]|nr:hypothetical protein [Fibrobacterota bacterium]
MLRKPILVIFLLLAAACQKESPTTAVEAPAATPMNVLEADPVVDARDRRTYSAVQIGQQVWMAENLEFDPKDSVWSRANPGLIASHRYYSWPSAMGGDTLLPNWCDVNKPPRGVCPAGWHLPDTSEWLVLARSLGGTEAAGQFLKGTVGWDPPLDGSAPDTGLHLFNARPFGYWTRGDQGFGLSGHTPPDSAFLEEGSRAAYWTRSNRVDFSCTSAWAVFLAAQDRGMRLLVVPRVTALNVRCLRDRDTTLPLSAK